MMLASPPIPLGQLTMTAGVAALVSEQPHIAEQLPALLACHARNACPHLSDDDRRANDWAIQNNERVLTSWPLSPERDGPHLWIITEHDRSLTTVMLPSEY